MSLIATTQGVALGWYVMPFQGSIQKVSIHLRYAINSESHRAHTGSYRVPESVNYFGLVMKDAESFKVYTKMV